MHIYFVISNVNPTNSCCDASSEETFDEFSEPKIYKNKSWSKLHCLKLPLINAESSL
jgi:hypothetical protein